MSKKSLKETTADKIIEIYESTSPEDEDFCDKMDTAVKLYDAINDEDENDISHDKDQSEEHGRLWDRVIHVGEIVLTAGLTVAGLVLTQKRFDRATMKEFDEPITGVTNRTVVQEGLREHKGFKL